MLATGGHCTRNRESGCARRPPLLGSANDYIAGAIAYAYPRDGPMRETVTGPGRRRTGGARALRSVCGAVSLLVALCALPATAQRRDFPTRPPGDPAAI